MVILHTHRTVGSARCFLSFLLAYNFRVEIKASLSFFLGLHLDFPDCCDSFWRCIKFKQWKRQGPIGEDCLTQIQHLSYQTFSTLFVEARHSGATLTVIPKNCPVYIRVLELHATWNKDGCKFFDSPSFEGEGLFLLLDTLKVASGYSDQ